MTLIVVVPPDPIITAAEAKARVPTLAAADDDVVTAQIAVATIAAENYTERAIGVQTLEWRPDECGAYAYQNSPYWLSDGPWGWRGYGATFKLPRPALVYGEDSPVIIKVLDVDGVEQTYDAANYIVSGVGGEGRITLKSGSAWPSLGAYPEPVRITYDAGYLVVPEPIVEWVLCAATAGYQRTARDATIKSETVDGVGSTSYGAPVEYAEYGLSSFVMGMLNPYRVFAP